MVSAEFASAKNKQESRKGEKSKLYGSRKSPLCSCVSITFALSILKNFLHCCSLCGIVCAIPLIPQERPSLCHTLQPCCPVTLQS